MKARLPALLLLASCLHPAANGGFDSLTCPDGEPVRVPRDADFCAVQFGELSRINDISAVTAAGVPQVEVRLGVEAAQRLEATGARLDVMSTQLRTQYQMACVAQTQTPCDAQLRADLKEQRRYLSETWAKAVTAYSEAAKASTADEFAESIGLVDSALPSRPQIAPTAGIAGTWSATLTHLRGMSCAEGLPAAREITVGEVGPGAPAAFTISTPGSSFSFEGLVRDGVWTLTALPSAGHYRSGHLILGADGTLRGELALVQPGMLEDCDEVLAVSASRI